MLLKDGEYFGAFGFSGDSVRWYAVFGYPGTDCPAFGFSGKRAVIDRFCAQGKGIVDSIANFGISKEKAVVCLMTKVAALYSVFDTRARVRAAIMILEVYGT